MLSPVIWFVEPKCTHSLLSHHNVYDGMSFSLSLKTNLAHVVCLCVWLFGGINVFLELQCSSCSFVYFFSWHAVHSVANCSSLCTVVVVWVFAVTPSFRCVFFFKAPTHVRSFFSVVLCFLVYFGIQQKKQEINCLVFCVLLLSVQHLKKEC